MEDTFTGRDTVCINQSGPASAYTPRGFLEVHYTKGLGEREALVIEQEWRRVDGVPQATPPQSPPRFDVAPSGVETAGDPHGEVDAWMASPAGQEAVRQARKEQAAQDSVEQPARPTIVAAFKGACTAKLIKGWFPCEPGVAYMVMPNGRSFIQFELNGQEFAFAGGHDRQPDINDLFLSINRVRIMKGSSQIAMDDHIEGECHLVFNDDASKFKFIHCDAWDRAKGLTFFFHLDKIAETKHDTIYPDSKVRQLPREPTSRKIQSFDRNIKMRSHFRCKDEASFNPLDSIRADIDWKKLILPS